MTLREALCELTCLSVRRVLDGLKKFIIWINLSLYVELRVALRDVLCELTCLLST